MYTLLVERTSSATGDIQFEGDVHDELVIHHGTDRHWQSLLWFWMVAHHCCKAVVRARRCYLRQPTSL